MPSLPTANTAAVQAVQRRGRRQGKLLIAPAQAVPGQVDHSLAARYKGQPPPLPGVGAGNRTEETARLPRLAAETVGQQHRLVPQRPAGVGCGGAKLPHAAGYLRCNVGQFLRRLRPQRPGLGRGSNGTFPPRPAPGRRLEESGAAGPLAIISSGCAGECRSSTMLNTCAGAHAWSEPPTLHARKPLADCVHLDDIRPAGQQLICDVLQFRGGEQRLLKQRTAAA